MVKQKKNHIHDTKISWNSIFTVCNINFIGIQPYLAMKVSLGWFLAYGGRAE